MSHTHSHCTDSYNYKSGCAECDQWLLRYMHNPLHRNVECWEYSIYIRDVMQNNLEAHKNCPKTETCSKCQTQYCGCACYWGRYTNSMRTYGNYEEDCRMCNTNWRSSFIQPVFKDVLPEIGRRLLYPDDPRDLISVHRDSPTAQLIHVNDIPVYVEPGMYVATFLKLALEPHLGIPFASQRLFVNGEGMNGEETYWIFTQDLTTMKFVIVPRDPVPEFLQARSKIGQVLWDSGIPRELVELVQKFVQIYRSHTIPILTETEKQQKPVPRMEVCMPWL